MGFEVIDVLPTYHVLPFILKVLFVYPRAISSHVHHHVFSHYLSKDLLELAIGQYTNSFTSLALLLRLSSKIA